MYIYINTLIYFSIIVLLIHTATHKYTLYLLKIQLHLLLLLTVSDSCLLSFLLVSRIIIFILYFLFLLLLNTTVYMYHFIIYVIVKSFLFYSFPSLLPPSPSLSLLFRFFSQLEGTHWLQYISQLLQTTVEVSRTLHHHSRPVLIHCSDGWDRTTQITSLVQLLLDPYYRSLEGFCVLVEREWLSFGHKFSDRCGFGPDGEQSPVFLQWLDCLYQLINQFPTSFEFNSVFLVSVR